MQTLSKTEATKAIALLDDEYAVLIVERKRQAKRQNTTRVFEINRRLTEIKMAMGDIDSEEG